MNEQELINEINTFCKNHANPELVKKYSRYFKTGYDAYGVSREELDNKCLSLLKEHDINIDTVLKAGETLFRYGKYEDGSFAVELLLGFKKEFSKKVFEGIGRWFSAGIGNWAHTDVICGEILSELLRRKIIVPEDFGPWITAPEKFKRRAVPVSLIKPVKRGLECRPLFDLTSSLMNDMERVVHQGMGWFLKETWKLHPVVTEEFLLNWKNTAPRLIISYATEKMDAGKKLQFR